MVISRENSRKSAREPEIPIAMHTEDNWKRVVDNTIFRQYTAPESRISYEWTDILPSAELALANPSSAGEKNTSTATEPPASFEAGEKDSLIEEVPEYGKFNGGEEDQFVTELAQAPPPKDSYRIIVFDSLSTKGLMMVGELYNLIPKDLWKASSKVNQPEVVSSKGKGKRKASQETGHDKVKGEDDGSAWKYLEVWTIWTKLDDGIDETLSKRIWRTRHIGLLFSKQKTFSVLFVLLAPLSNTDDHFHFCYRNQAGFVSADPYNWIAAEAPLRDMINKIQAGLENKGPKYSKDFFVDVLWGWERYLAQVRADITGIMLKSSRAWQDELHDQICWRFSKYKFVVNETHAKFRRDLRYLQEYLKHINRENCNGMKSTVDWRLPLDKEGLQKILDRIENIIKDLDSLKVSLDQVTTMGYSHMSIKEAQVAYKSNHRMEYLALLATVFLPLSLFTGAFGMNVTGLSPTGTPWWLFLIVSLPSSFVFAGLIYYIYWTPKGRKQVQRITDATRQWQAKEGHA